MFPVLDHFINDGFKFSMLERPRFLTTQPPAMHMIDRSPKHVMPACRAHLIHQCRRATPRPGTHVKVEVCQAINRLLDICVTKYDPITYNQITRRVFCMVGLGPHARGS